MKLAARCLLAALLGLLLSTAPASARMIMIAPSAMPQRVATADSVLIGKVTSIEPKTIKAARFPGDMEKGEYTIAVVKIDEGLRGTKGLTHLRVGFIRPSEGDVGGGRIRISSRRPAVTLAKDEEVLLFLKQHPEGTFHTAPMYFDVVRKKLAKEDNPSFAIDVAAAKKAARLLADPTTGLKSANAEDRFATAAMLLLTYRQQSANPNPKTAPIDPAESSLILTALAEADWNPPPGKRTALQPQGLFALLGLTPQDGWTPPTDFRQFPAEAKKWLVKYKDSYRIHRFVAEPAAAP